MQTLNSWANRIDSTPQIIYITLMLLSGLMFSIIEKKSKEVKYFNEKKLQEARQRNLYAKPQQIKYYYISIGYGLVFFVIMAILATFYAYWRLDQWRQSFYYYSGITVTASIINCLSRNLKVQIFLTTLMLLQSFVMLDTTSSKFIILPVLIIKTISFIHLFWVYVLKSGKEMEDHFLLLAIVLVLWTLFFVDYTYFCDEFFLLLVTYVASVGVYIADQNTWNCAIWNKQ